MRIEKEKIKEMRRCRRKIDKIDNKILRLLNSRIKTSKMLFEFRHF